MEEKCPNCSCHEIVKHRCQVGRYDVCSSCRFIFNLEGKGIIQNSNQTNLRDHFAGLAMQAIGIKTGFAGLDESIIAEMSYEMADGMLDERNKKLEE